MKSDKRVKAIARVVLEVEADGVWGGDCTFDQIYKQAEDGIRGLFTSRNGTILAEVPKRVKSITVVEVRVASLKERGESNE